MPRTRHAEAAELAPVERAPLALVPTPAESTQVAIYAKTRRRYTARKKHPTKDKLVQLRAVDEARMLALAESWGTSATGAIREALRLAALTLVDISEEADE